MQAVGTYKEGLPDPNGGPNANIVTHSDDSDNDNQLKVKRGCWIRLALSI